ncbi:hypothetical protein SAICODRAFT_205003 [Saitoella complicata NRRL Y-17804]|uniref:uncharacterized protein n=1 Tax=Saitoella complicata (strain BCRC 22490 / CBS 7301 / JCM 7358 / NBRC 10748 / NRRL Y-17804) TaxID=698492 RepID=UPI000868024F|nr:uncharacterized protein SAICODRAFT_205003 [Saitoella complicata NRRL Y-17804]ODQ54737.1 hypothetical protein SAICODRAFT_205003 [Saitoella complicata NRRL Y-17804]
MVVALLPWLFPDAAFPVPVQISGEINSFLFFSMGFLVCLDPWPGALQLGPSRGLQDEWGEEADHTPRGPLGFGQVSDGRESKGLGDGERWGLGD